MMLLRTPDERFASLLDFPFEPHHVELAEGIWVHHLDEGPEGAAPVPPVLTGSLSLKAHRNGLSKGAGHFLQEDAGERLATVIVDFIAAT